MPLPADRPSEPAPSEPPSGALRQRWQDQTRRRQLQVGVPILALVGGLCGAAVGRGSGTALIVAALLGALLVVLIGLAVAWLSARPVQVPQIPVAPDLAKAHGRGDSQAIRDALTGAYSQRYFIAAADREWSRIRRHGEDAALLMIDVDHLRSVNEQHGPDCGDAVLVQLTRLIGATLRQYDLLARFNAGVWVVYLPHTDPMGAIDVAERIRDRVASFRMTWPTGPVAVTISVGVAAIGADHSALDSVIGDAGAALRAAKAAGRNCVRAGPVPPKRQPADGTRQGDHRPH